MKNTLFTLLLFLAGIYTGFAQFITTWETTSDNQSIIIPTNPAFTYNYTVDWGDGNTSTNQTGNAQHTYGSAGTYLVSITGAFPAIYFNVVGPFNPALSANRNRIKTVEQWGNNSWQSMNNAFSGCSSLVITATDTPNLSSVTDMSLMFYQATNLTVDASAWNVSNVTLMPALFNQADNFNSDIGNWDVSNVTNMSSMFYEAGNFNQDIGNWDVSSVTNMSRMFNRAFAFNQDITNWDVSNVTDMSAMFEQAFVFNQNIGNWDVGNVTNMNSMFLRNPVFNQPIGNWNVSNVTDMGEMFQDTIFNQPLGTWDVSSVTTMTSMFEDAVSFDQDISNWDVSNVTDMSLLFLNAQAFNQDIGPWNVSNVVDMSSMFYLAQTFNQDIGNWNVSNVTDMSRMFNEAMAFNQNIGNWDVSNVTDMSSMFEDASAFNQDLSGWNISNVDDMFDMLNFSNLSITNYDSTLIGWSSQSVVSNVSLGAEGLLYCNGDAARAVLTSPPNNWSIYDDALDCSAQPFFNIPDPNFEQALIDDNIDSDGIINGQMLESDALGITFLDVNSENISDLTGIEFFLDLETLNATNNNLSTIDLSANLALDGLLLGINNLTSIDLSNNTNLVSLVLAQNQISSIDLSVNTALTQVFIQNNTLTEFNANSLPNLAQLNVSQNDLTLLDLSLNTNLTQLLASGNNLISLNLQNGTNTTIASNDFDVTLNENLTCIQVDDVNYSTNTWPSIDPQSFFGLDCVPTNDDCSFAIPIVLAQDTPGTTNSSSPSGFNPNCEQSGVVIFDVWYEFTAPSSGSITLTAIAENSGFTVKIALYNDCTSTTPIACDANNIQINNLNPGQTYYAQIWLEASTSGLLAQTENTAAGDFTITAEDSSLSVDAIDKPLDFSLYPNPAQDRVTIYSSRAVQSIQIFDLNGRAVLIEKNLSSIEKQVDVSQLSQGTYLLKINSGNATLTQKLIIK